MIFFISFAIFPPKIGNFPKFELKRFTYIFPCKRCQPYWGRSLELVCENRILSHPAATGSIPAAADQEDFVSMGMTTALKTQQIIDNAQAVIGVEFMAGAQAVDFRKPIKPGKGVQAAARIIRKHVDHLEEDRPLYDDINKLKEVVESGEILEAVENAVGPLK